MCVILCVSVCETEIERECVSYVYLVVVGAWLLWLSQSSACVCDRERDKGRKKTKNVFFLKERKRDTRYFIF